MFIRSSAFLLVSAWLVGCLPIAGGSDAAIDAGPSPDAPSFVDAPSDAGVDSATDAGPPVALFVAPEPGEDPSTFFDLPWPTDARLTAEGTPELASFPAPSRGLIRTYLDSITASQHGYSTMGAVYFRLTHDVDPASFPSTLEGSVASDASVFLVALDERVPAADARHPAVLRYEPRQTEYWPGHALAIRPADGFPLLPDTTYAAVLTDRLRAVGGAGFGRDGDFEAVLAADPSVAALSAIYGPALDRLEVLGVPRGSVVSLAVFTTQDPSATLAAAADWTRTTLAAPTLVPAEWSTRESSSAFTVVHGHYAGAPTFQEGVAPYRSVGGAIELDADGAPTVAGTYEARFALSVPVSAMPAGGYPLVLYSHGTGGNFRTFIEDSTAQLLGEQGYAVMGIDAPLHGDRNPTTESPDVLFFNILNPQAVRCNPIQAALDHVVQARVASSLVIPRATLERDGGEVRFDPDRIYFVGHSQGALVGPLFFGVDGTARAALFSAGGSLIGHTLLEKTEPLDIPSLVRSLLGFSGANTAEAFAAEGFNLEHPVVTLLQGWVDASDPGNYAPLAHVRPLAGIGPRSVITTEGLRDVYVSPAGMEALATAFGVPIAAPVARDIPGLRLLGLAPEPGEVRGNLAGGTVTGALLQFPMSGHFAFFDEPRGRERIASFFASLHAGGPGTLPGP